MIEDSWWEPVSSFQCERRSDISMIVSYYQHAVGDVFYDLLTDCDVGALRWVHAVSKIFINYNVTENEGDPGILPKCLLGVGRVCPSHAHHSSWSIPCIVQEYGSKTRCVSQRRGSDPSGRQKALSPRGLWPRISPGCCFEDKGHCGPNGGVPKPCLCECPCSGRSVWWRQVSAVF